MLIESFRIFSHERKGMKSTEDVSCVLDYFFFFFFSFSFPFPRDIGTCTQKCRTAYTPGLTAALYPRKWNVSRTMN